MDNKNEYTRWAQKGPGTFVPSDNLLIRERLPAGVYNVHVKESYHGTEINLSKLVVDRSNLLDIKQPEEQYINSILDNFCSKKEEFAKLKISYKTGILLYGIPGGGKTSILTSVIERVQNLDGVCFLLKNAGDLYSYDKFYKQIYRKIEPDRLLLNIFEDIDGMAGGGGDTETTLINILDGIGDCNNVINIATTNYTENLSPRLVNRPGRFDRRIEIKSPTIENRRKYLDLRLPDEFKRTIDMEKWIKETDNFTLAQLNEIVKSVLLLDENFDDIVKKIRDMCNIPQSYDYNKDKPKSVGFKRD